MDVRYKIQIYSETNISWGDIQQNYDNLEEAQGAFKKIKDKKRLLKITGKTREIVAENMCNHVIRPAYIKTINGKKTVNWCSLNCGYMEVNA